MKRLSRAIMSLCVGMALMCANQAHAGEVDVLLKILVKKGILTETEAAIVKDETKQTVAADLAAQKSYAVPGWVQKTKFKGDLRLRYQDQRRKGKNDRHRGRYRFRLGLESEITDDILVAAGIATGGSDPRSTNQTFTNAFETPDVRMDYAYAKYSPLSYVDIYGGKMKRKPVLWAPSDLMWDGDINPEGAAVAASHKLSKHLDGFFNTGFWVLDESSSDSSDPYLKYVQPGLVFGLGNGIKLKTALTYYMFENVQQSTLDNSAGTNTLDVNGGLATGFRTLHPAAEMSVKEPFDGIVNYASLFGEYATNLDDDFVSETDAWVIGMKFGDKKVKKPGQWQFKYMFKRMEMDAFPDIFADSDHFDGDTNTRGHEWIFNYAVAKNVVLGLDYYRTNTILGSDTPEHLIQTDIVIKF